MSVLVCFVGLLDFGDEGVDDVVECFVGVFGWGCGFECVLDEVECSEVSCGGEDVSGVVADFVDVLGG